MLIQAILLSSPLSFISLSARTPSQFLYPSVCVQVGERSRMGNSHKGCLDARFSGKWHPQPAGDEWHQHLNLFQDSYVSNVFHLAMWPGWTLASSESTLEPLLFHSLKRWSQNFETSDFSVGLTPKPCRFFNGSHGEFFYLYESLDKKSWNITIWLKWAIGPINL